MTFIPVKKTDRAMPKILSHIFRKAGWSRPKVPVHVKKVFKKNNSCYVLISCSEPTADGNMQVEMTYEGDAILAAYLIESAQGIMDRSSNDHR